MGQIEHVGKRSSPAVRTPGSIEARPPVDIAFAGQPVDYVSTQFTFDESWQMLSPAMRQWAEERAGDAIRDPHSGVRTVYWYCRVIPDGIEGPRSAAISAAYELVMFGKRGLVVGTGTTDSLHTSGAGGAEAKWRHRRFDMPVDQSAIRHDHRQAPANTATDGTVGPVAGPAGVGSAHLLPVAVSRTFGNLPVATQRFLLEPFTVRGKRPVEAGVHATTTEVGHMYRETYWCYLFDAGWVAFAHAQRSVPLTSGRTGPALWNGSPEAAALRRAPWTVAAWVAPAKKRDRSVVKA